jgi:hypothetical protein
MAPAPAPAAAPDPFIAGLQALRRSCTDAAALDGALKTIRVYVKNAADNPGNKQYLTIKKTNKAFASRVAAVPNAVALLLALGWEEEEEAGEPVLVLKDVNRGKLWDALTKVDLLISK